MPKKKQKQFPLIKVTLIALLALSVILQVVLFRGLSRRISTLEDSLGTSQIEHPKARIAIVLDDWGYNDRYLKNLREIQAPFTLAILPNLPYSGKIAGFAEQANCEVILHQPMESTNPDRNPEKITIEVDDTKEEILAKLDQALRSIPEAQGISNHMGSRVTAEPKIMRIIFTELKKRKLYFLDSAVTLNSVGSDLAERINVKFARRDVFIDNKPDPEYIRGQINELINVALVEGEAVGIGHNRPNTIKVLREMLSEFQDNEIKLVHLSELVE